MASLIRGARTVPRSSSDWLLTDPGRDLLGEVRAPVSAAALSAQRLAGTASTIWEVRGESVAEREVHRVQWQWYRDNPWLVDAGYARHAETLKVLQLA